MAFTDRVKIFLILLSTSVLPVVKTNMDKILVMVKFQKLNSK